MPEPSPTAASPNTEAGRYLRKVGERWHHERGDLETKWNTNRDHFNRVFKKVFKSKDGEGWRSRAVPGYLRQKVMTAYALMIDLMLQNGRIPFAMKPSRRLRHQAGFDNEIYAASVQRAQDRIQDQFALCRADRAFMSNIFAGALYGRTWAKKTRGIFSEAGWEPVPIPGVRDMHSINPDTLSYRSYMSEYTGPAWEYVSNWEMFADPEWDHPRDPNSTGTFQERLVTPRWLRDRRQGDYYIPHNIDLVLRNVTRAQFRQDKQDTDTLPPYLRKIVNLKRLITYREWWVWIPREIAEQTEKELVDLGRGRWAPPTLNEEAENSGDDVYVMCCTANDEVVRWAKVNPNEFPFFMCDWDKAVDEPMPNGVADNAEFAQNLLAGSIRMYINNKRLACNVQHAANTSIFKNPPKEVEPGTVVHLKGSTDDLKKGWQQIITEDVGENLMGMIRLGLQFGDEDTLIPKIAQGLDDDKDKTAYEVSQQLSRSDKYTGSVARNYDEALIEPIATEFHRDNMEDPDIQDGQGDYVVEAQGFQAVQDRIYRVSIYRQLLDLALSNPELARRAKIGPMLDHITRAMTVDPNDVWLSEEELPDPAAAGPTPEEQEAMAVQTDAARAKAEKDIAGAEAARLKAQTDAAKVELEAERMEREQAQAAAQPGMAAQGA